MPEIRLSSGVIAVVDAIDLDYLSQYEWNQYSSGSRNILYAQRDIQVGGKYTSLKMHREIAIRAGLIIEGFEVDHQDRNGLNNQRYNLRVATHSQNLHNTGIWKNNTSGIKGVAWHQQAQKWTVYININRSRTYLGLYTTLEEALIARSNAERWL